MRADEGYFVEGVYCNGEKMQYNADKGVYQIVVSEDSVITANVKPIVEDSSDSSEPATSEKDSNSTGKSSCKSAIITESLAICFIVGITLFVITILRRRKTVN